MMQSRRLIRRPGYFSPTIDPKDCNLKYKV